MLCSIKKLKISFKSIVSWICTRLVKMMSGFYFIYAIVFAITFIIDKYPIARYYPNTSVLKGTLAMIIDFLGLAKLFDTRTLISTWWYMSAAIVFVIVCPFLYILAKKLKYTTLILAVVIVPRLTIGYPGSKSWFSFLLALIFGMMFADYNLFEKLDKIKITKNDKVSNVILFVIFLALLVAIVLVNNSVKWSVCWEWDFSIAPLIVVLFAKKFITPIKGVRNVLYILGKYSMDIYLTHTFFRYVYLKNFIYSFKYAILIWTVLMVISLASSIAIEYLKKLIRYDKLVVVITEYIAKALGNKKNA